MAPLLIALSFQQIFCVRNMLHPRYDFAILVRRLDCHMRHSLIRSRTMPYSLSAPETSVASAGLPHFNLLNFQFQGGHIDNVAMRDIALVHVYKKNN